MARDIAERHNVIPTLGELFREYGFAGTSLAEITHRTVLARAVFIIFSQWEKRNG